MLATLLALACLLQAVIIAVLAGTIPYLWHHTHRAETKIEELDEVMASLCEIAGLQPRGRLPPSYNPQGQATNGEGKPMRMRDHFGG